MPKLDITNPKTINFLLENYEKENRIRIKWAQLHASNFEKAATLTREAKNYTPEDLTKAAIEAGMAATTRDHYNSAPYRYKVPFDYNKLVKVKTQVKMPEVVMKPMISEDTELLKESRNKFLKRRYLLAPDEKYNYVECSNWQYGWKLSESNMQTSGSVHRKVDHVLNFQHSRVGPQRDPDHYKSPDPGQKVYTSL